MQITYFGLLVVLALSGDAIGFWYLIHGTANGPNNSFAEPIVTGVTSSSGEAPAKNPNNTNLVFDWGPWAMDRGVPVVVGRDTCNTISNHSVPSDTSNVTQANIYSMVWLRIYQRWISRLHTTRCPMEPSCSNYSIQAIRKHGSILGIIMTADRLIHEASVIRYAPITSTKQGPRYIDSVECNDYWWHKGTSK